VRKRRLDRLMRLQQGISLEANRALIGTDMDVLVEELHGDVRVGRSCRDAPDIDGLVHVSGSSAAPGEIIRATVTGASEYDLHATCAESQEVSRVTPDGNTTRKRNVRR